MTPLNPLASDYSKHWMGQHASRVAEYFESLVGLSMVDEQLNIRTVAGIHGLESSLALSGASLNKWRFARIVGFVGSLALIGIAFSLRGWNYFWLLLSSAIALAIFRKVNPAIKYRNGEIANLEGQLNVKVGEAWAQMKPLNDLHMWETARTLFQLTAPGIKLDRCFTEERLVDLIHNFDLSEFFNQRKAMVALQSGSIRENPFVIARYIRHFIGESRYRGSITIHWKERVGKDLVSRSQTLSAYVDKPFPEYVSESRVIYGHEGAPDLTFSRIPSKLSGLDDRRGSERSKNRALRKVERHARRDVKSGEGQFTVMANRDFEVLFGASDRDHEVQFRLLFTPSAQEAMVGLLNDNSVGYGDDFKLIKLGKINFVEPTHLQQFRFDSDPRMFMSNDIQLARSFFNEFHNEYFRSLYFSLAPLMTIPIYQESRSDLSGYEPAEEIHVSAWEEEVMAYFLGESLFAHPASVTTNLIKTSSSGFGLDNLNRFVSVTSYGYRSVQRVDYVSVFGGDGRYHDVPVPWIEYIPVQKESKMLVGVVETEREDPDGAIQSRLRAQWIETLGNIGLTESDSVFRGPLAAAHVGDYYTPANPINDAVVGGWYPDPSNTQQKRFWDGTQWTDQVASLD